MQEVKSRSEGQQKKECWNYKLFPIHFPVPVDNCTIQCLIHDGQIYGYGCLLLYKVKAISLNTWKITHIVVFNKHPYNAPAFQTESSSVR